MRPFLPTALKQKIPVRGKQTAYPQTEHKRKMLLLDGCAQGVVTPETNAAAARVLNKLGIQTVTLEKNGCCGAVSHHLSAEDEALKFVRANIDNWWPVVEEQKVEAIISTASGCGTMVKDYAHLLKHDSQYAEKARIISALTRDISEILKNEQLPQVGCNPALSKVAFHSPCTLQHGQQLSGVVEGILTRTGYNLMPVADAHLCCGSAGTYSVLQPELSQKLLGNKLTNLQKEQPDVIVTANIGCQMHLATKAQVPVKHWIELLDESIQPEQSS